DLDVRNIADPDRDIAACGDHRPLDVGNTAEPRIDSYEQGLASPVDEVRPLGKIGPLECGNQLVERDAIAGEACRVRLHQVLLFVTADRIHAGDAIDVAHQRRDDPVLHA